MIKGTTSFSSAPQVQTYEALNQYEIMEVIVDNYPANHVVKAKKTSTGDIWFICYRHSEFFAQVDKAASDIFRKYVPSTPVVHIIQNSDDFYVATKEITDLVPMYDLPTETDSSYQYHQFGSNSVVSHFLGESDIHSGNTLITTKDKKIFTAHKIDNAESLDPEKLQTATLGHEEVSFDDNSDKEDGDPSCDEQSQEVKDFAPLPEPAPFSLDDIFANHWLFPKEVVNHFQYKKEQRETFKAITATPFSEFADILRTNITASNFEGNLSFLGKLLKSDFYADKASKAAVKKSLDNPKLLPKVCECEDLIKLLEKRHRQYVKLG